MVSSLAGRLRQLYANWLKLTNDAFVLHCIRGFQIPFSQPPVQLSIPPNSYLQVGFSEADASLAVSKLCALGAIRPCSPVANQFVSPFFPVPKPDGSTRFILNLHQLNRFVPIDHFQIRNANSARAI